MPGQDADLSKLTFLVVEDQEHIRCLIVQLLARLEVGRVLEEADGGAALRLMSSESPDFILCDVWMEPVDGLAFLRRLRSGEVGTENAAVPVVFLTADSEQGTVMAAIEGDVDGYLVKPVSLADLRTKITAILDRRRSGLRPKAVPQPRPVS
ncbi:MAG: response regulator [Telmatospirillum sp.]|nr:response regulator [Telmatospirillum sp.]